MKRLVYLFCTITLATIVAYAQPKEESIGLGASTGWAEGANLTYVIGQDVHLGFQLGAYIDGKFAPTIAPQVRYFLSHNGNFHPFVIGSVLISDRAQLKDGTQRLYFGSKMDLIAGAGASYFPAKDVHIYAQLSAVELPLNGNSELAFGLLKPAIGIEWFIW